MKDYDAELKRIQDIALDHAIEEMDASDGLTVETKEDRGNRGFLTGMASKSIGVAVKIEQFMALKKGNGSAGWDDPAEEAKAAAALVNSARAEVAKVMERAGVGPTTRR